MIRVLLADDHVLIREGTRALLAPASNIEVIGEAGRGEEALAMIEELNPDVVLLDIRLEGIGGIEVARHLNRNHSPAKVLVLTAYPYETYVRALFAVGVHGYLLKKASGTELIAAISAVHRGEQVVDPDIAHNRVDAAHPSDDCTTRDLSIRELEVLSLIRDGASNKEVAQALDIGVRTVESYLSNAMTKLGARSRVEAMNLATELGILGRHTNARASAASSA